MRAALLALVCLATSPVAVLSQLSCLTPSTCSVAQRSPGARVSLAVRVQSGTDGITVSFRGNSLGSAAHTVVTSGGGVAQFDWVGTVPSGGREIITASATISGTARSVSFTITSSPTWTLAPWVDERPNGSLSLAECRDRMTEHLGLRRGRGPDSHQERSKTVKQEFDASCRDHSGLNQHWMAGTQLRHPLSFEIVGPVSEAECRRAATTFEAIGEKSLASPKTVRPTWHTSSQCVASARWVLANHVGRQHIRATLEGHPGASLDGEVVARSFARVMVGLGLEFFATDFEGVSVVRSDTIWTFNGTELRRVVDDSSAVAQQTVSSTVRPFVLVDFPPIPTWERLRVGVGAALNDLDEYFVVSASLLQPGWGVQMEAIPVDLHLFLEFRRRSEARTSGCAGGKAFCTEKTLALHGIGLMGVFDAGSTIQKFLSALTG